MCTLTEFQIFVQFFLLPKSVLFKKSDNKCLKFVTRPYTRILFTAVWNYVLKVCIHSPGRGTSNKCIVWSEQKSIGKGTLSQKVLSVKRFGIFPCPKPVFRIWNSSACLLMTTHGKICKCSPTPWDPQAYLLIVYKTAWYHIIDWLTAHMALILGIVKGICTKKKLRQSLHYFHYFMLIIL